MATPRYKENRLPIPPDNAFANLPEVQKIVEIYKKLVNEYIETTFRITEQSFRITEQSFRFNLELLRHDARKEISKLNLYDPNLTLDEVKEFVFKPFQNAGWVIEYSDSSNAPTIIIKR